MRPPGKTFSNTHEEEEDETYGKGVRRYSCHADRMRGGIDPDDKMKCNVCGYTGDYIGGYNSDFKIWDKGSVFTHGDGDHNLIEGDFLCKECWNKVIDELWEKVKNG